MSFKEYVESAACLKKNYFKNFYEQFIAWFLLTFINPLLF
jgi:hypothetical protein